MNDPDYIGEPVEEVLDTERPLRVEVYSRVGLLEGAAHLERGADGFGGGVQPCRGSGSCRGRAVPGP